MKNFILLFVITLLITSCSNPLEKPYKKDSAEEDIITLKKSIPQDEYEMLVGYIALMSLGDDNMLGKTYGDLLKEAKALSEEIQKKEEEEKRLAEKAKIEAADRIKRLGEALTVSLFEKGFMEHDYREYITFKFAFQNKTENDIKAFKGEFIINDLFDKQVKKLNLTYDDGIKANSTVNWDPQIDYNRFMDDDVELRSKEIDDLKFEWIPEKIIFIDGSILE